MRHTFRVLAIASVVALLFGVSVAAGDPIGVTAKIPFSFTAGDELLPPGEYLFTPDYLNNPAVIKLEAKDGVEREYRLIDTYDLYETPEESKIVFEKIGSEHYLSQVWIAGMDVIQVVPQSKIDKEMERSAQGSETVDVPAHKMAGQM